MNGRISYEANPLGRRPFWSITGKPHPITRLKRLFPRADKGQSGQVALTDTPETCRELLWFTDRYPMEIDKADAERLRRGADAHLQREHYVREILSGKASAEGAVPIVVAPRPYQLQAAELANATGRLLLADEIGVGKTASAITTLAKAGKFPALVVTLTHLPRQFEAEVNRFCPSLRTKVLRGGSPGVHKSDKIVSDLFGLPDVIILSYSKLAGWVDTLAPICRAIIFDEIQELRKHDSNKYRAACGLAERADLRMGLSATPVYNYGGEIYNVLNVLDPDCIGSREEFHREWCGYAAESDDKARIRDPKGFGIYLRDSGIMLRRTRRDVGRELPALQTIPHYVDTDPKALNALLGTAAVELAQRILDDSGEVAGERWRAHGEFDNKMRQATGIAKAPAVADFVSMLLESEERVVLFGWHKAVYDLWRHKLKQFDPVFYTGEQSQAAKAYALAKFRDGDSRLLVISLRAGAGIDGLQHLCRTVVFGELDWSPGVHEQCIGRVYRDGQEEPVCAYYLLAEDGADPIMSDVLGVKKAQIEGLRDPDAEIVTPSIDPNHLKKLAKDYLTRKGLMKEAKSGN